MHPSGFCVNLRDCFARPCNHVIICTHHKNFVRKLFPSMTCPVCKKTILETAIQIKRGFNE